MSFHFCQDELMAITAGLPLIGYLCMRCRQACRACVSLFLRLRGRRTLPACTHHNYGEK